MRRAGLCQPDRQGERPGKAHHAHAQPAVLGARTEVGTACASHEEVLSMSPGGGRSLYSSASIARGNCCPPMQRLLRRLFDVRAGEGTAALQAALTIFTLLSAHTMLETARDALFLQRLEPSRLTLVYAL